MPDAVIWDVDGTLVDTAELHFQAWAELAGQLDKPFSREDFAATFGWRNQEIIPELFGSHHTDEEVMDLGERKEERYRGCARNGVDLLPGVRGLLEGLQAAGYRQGIGSSAPRANVELILQLTHSESFFGTIVSDGDTQRGKPDPEVFQTAAARLGVPTDRCLVLEDAPAGVQAAKAGGMKCIAVNFVGHHSASVLTEAGADLVVETLEQVTSETVKKFLS